jgi:L-ribulose-5-phosphate 4-epimerase
MAVLEIETGGVVAGGRRPSSDTPTHLEIYRGFPGVGAVVHAHSIYATAWAQLARPLPCAGTTHADHFCGSIPVARPLTQAEIADDYERACGKSVVETFQREGLDPQRVPAIFLPGHAPFVWGATAQAAVENAVALEIVAQMALWMSAAQTPLPELPEPLRRKHFERKHGPRAYYGQDRSP